VKKEDSRLADESKGNSLEKLDSNMLSEDHTSPLTAGLGSEQ